MRSGIRICTRRFSARPRTAGPLPSHTQDLSVEAGRNGSPRAPLPPDAGMAVHEFSFHCLRGAPAQAPAGHRWPLNIGLIIRFNLRSVVFRSKKRMDIKRTKEIELSRNSFNDIDQLVKWSRSIGWDNIGTQLTTGKNRILFDAFDLAGLIVGHYGIQQSFHKLC